MKPVFGAAGGERRATAVGICFVKEAWYETLQRKEKWGKNRKQKSFVAALAAMAILFGGVTEVLGYINNVNEGYYNIYEGDHNTMIGEHNESYSNYVKAIGVENRSDSEYVFLAGYHSDVGERSRGAIAIGNHIYLGTDRKFESTATELGNGVTYHRYINNWDSSDAIALGDETSLSSDRSVAIGYKNKVSAADSIAIGQSNHLYEGIWGGDGANDDGGYTVVLGKYNRHVGNRGGVLGDSNEVYNDSVKIVGDHNIVESPKAFVAGGWNKVGSAASSSIVIGQGNKMGTNGAYESDWTAVPNVMSYKKLISSTAARSIALGNENMVHIKESSAVGRKNRLYDVAWDGESGGDTMVLGTGNESYGMNAGVLGNDNRVYNHGVRIIGSNNRSDSAEVFLAGLGNNVGSKSNRAIVIGNDNNIGASPAKEESNSPLGGQGNLTESIKRIQIRTER